MIDSAGEDELTPSDRWVGSRRGSRNPVDPSKPYAFLSEEEPVEDGTTASVSTVFLTNRECPWRCVMCDLWKNTLTTSVAPGVIPNQIRFALSALNREKSARPLRHLKLYNSGSFFDPAAIPLRDHAEIAELCDPFDRVIVECHPKLVGPRVVEFRSMLDRRRLLPERLEVALGLETAHPEALERLNKRMTVEDFEKASRFLKRHGCRVRVFLLVHPPFVPATQGREWLSRSMSAAFSAGASVISLIPTRIGSGVMEELALQGRAAEPSLAELEAGFESGLRLRRGQVFVDLWDLERFSRCEACFAERRARLAAMNAEQLIRPSVSCKQCGSTL